MDTETALFRTIILSFVIGEKWNCERRQPFSGIVRNVGVLKQQVKYSLKGPQVSGLPAFRSDNRNVFNRSSGRALSRSGINTVAIPGTEVCIFFHCSATHDLDLKDKPVSVGSGHWTDQWAPRSHPTVSALARQSTDQGYRVLLRNSFTATKISQSRDRGS